ncbi:MAG TPA: hypothetical protein VNQ53_16655 [Nocardioides sp.]|nr:hypothetical protein [Nocardioides sp.]
MKRLALVGALLAALMLPTGGLPAAAGVGTAGDESATAKVWSGDGVLRKGCHGHGYGYAVDVPDGDSWSLEVSLVNRKGRTLFQGYELIGADPKQGKGRFLYCAHDLRPGRYKVKAELVWSHYSDEYHKWARPRTIHLRRR